MLVNLGSPYETIKLLKEKVTFSSAPQKALIFKPS